MSIFPIIVIYNTDLKDSRTYKSLLGKRPDMPLLVYDNSPEPLNAKYAGGRILYHNDRSNGGVSAAYNYGCRLAEDQGSFDGLLLLDDDTLFDEDYIDKLTEAMSRNIDVDVFAPTVLYGKNQPFSPVKFSFLKSRGVRLKSGRHSLSQYLPINSGTCVRIEAFKRAGGYNERIRLDFADFDFFSRIKRFNNTFCVVDSIAHQRFSNDETDVDKLIERFECYLDGARNTVFKWFCMGQALRHTAALTFRTRRFVFVKLFINKFLRGK